MFFYVCEELVHYLCWTFVVLCKAFSKNPVNIYLFKVNNRNTGRCERCEICSKLTKKYTRTTSLTSYFISFSSISTVEFEKVNVSWEFQMFSFCCCFLNFNFLYKYFLQILQMSTFSMHQVHFHRKCLNIRRFTRFGALCTI